eukprot:6205501-Pleurochrysis_carterae.AAC.1
MSNSFPNEVCGGNGSPIGARHSQVQKKANKQQEAGRAAAKVAAQKNDLQEAEIIQQFWNMCYFGSCEAAWRLLWFKIFDTWNTVTRLEVHMPDEMHVLYADNEEGQGVQRGLPTTTLTDISCFVKFLRMLRISISGGKH